MKHAIVTFVVSSVFLVPAGCGAKKDAPAPAVKIEAKNDAPPKDAPKVVVPKDEPKKSNPGLSTLVARRFEVAETQNLLRQIGVAYLGYMIENNRGPDSREQLAPSYENNGKINQLLKEGDVVVFWKAHRPAEPAATVLAHEAAADASGQRLVLTFDGAVALVPESDFQKMPKPQQRK